MQNITILQQIGWNLEWFFVLLRGRLKEIDKRISIRCLYPNWLTLDSNCFTFTKIKNYYIRVYFANFWIIFLFVLFCFVLLFIFNCNNVEKFQVKSFTLYWVIENLSRSNLGCKLQKKKQQINNSYLQSNTSKIWNKFTRFRSIFCKNLWHHTTRLLTILKDVHLEYRQLNQKLWDANEFFVESFSRVVCT